MGINSGFLEIFIEKKMHPSDKTSQPLNTSETFNFDLHINSIISSVSFKLLPTGKPWYNALSEAKSFEKLHKELNTIKKNC